MALNVPDDILKAIGNLVAHWATAETILAIQVARLAATEENLEYGTLTFNPRTFLFVSAIALGSNARATLAQMENLAYANKEQIRSIGASLMKLKEKRDRIAHSMPWGQDGIASFHSIAGSRKNYGQSYPYSASDINGWAESVAAKLNQLTDIVDQLTGLPIERSLELARQWGEDHQAEVRRFEELSKNQDSDPQAMQEC